MEHNFKVGDRVVVIDNGSKFFGQVCTITEGPRFAVRVWQNGVLIGTNETVFRVDIRRSGPDITPIGTKFKSPWSAYPPRSLKPYYDGNEPCAFDESLWSPIKVTA